MALITPRPLEPDWEPVLARAMRRSVDPRALALMVSRVSRRYLGEQVELAHADELLARALFWFPRDLRKVALPVAELARVGALPARPLRVLDVGAGTGATSLGLLRALADEARSGLSVPPVAQIDALDVDAQALALLERIASEATRAGLLGSPMPALRTHVGDLREPSALPGAGPYDLVLVGTALVELTRALGEDLHARGAAIAEHIAALIERAPLAPDGALVVIEPATRPETRALHHARARLIERGLGIFAPCTHQLECPMLARERDWCHEDLAADLPPWLQHVAREAGLRWEGLTFSYLVVRRDRTRSVAELVPARGALLVARLVSRPIETKGKVEAFASGPFPGPTRGPRVMQLEREAKHAVEGQVRLDECSRGDIVGIETAAAARAEAGKPVRLAPGELVRVKSE